MSRQAKEVLGRWQRKGNEDKHFKQAKKKLKNTW
jgi:hypothetical protein